MSVLVPQRLRTYGRSGAAAALYLAVTAHLTDDLIDSLLDPAQYTGLAGVFVDRVVNG